MMPVLLSIHMGVSHTDVLRDKLELRRASASWRKKEYTCAHQDSSSLLDNQYVATSSILFDVPPHFVSHFVEGLRSQLPMSARGGGDGVHVETTTHPPGISFAVEYSFRTRSNTKRAPSTALQI